jgi:hypothetical protein
MENNPAKSSAREKKERVRISIRLSRAVIEQLRTNGHKRCFSCKVKPLSESEIVEAALIEYLRLSNV